MSTIMLNLLLSAEEFSQLCQRAADKNTAPDNLALQMVLSGLREDRADAKRRALNNYIAHQLKPACSATQRINRELSRLIQFLES